MQKLMIIDPDEQLPAALSDVPGGFGTNLDLEVSHRLNIGRHCGGPQREAARNGEPSVGRPAMPTWQVLRLRSVAGVVRWGRGDRNLANRPFGKAFEIPVLASVAAADQG